MSEKTANSIALTAREQEVLDLLLAGSVPKEISAALNISHATVLDHKKNLYRKLDVHNINELLAMHLKEQRPENKITQNVENEADSLLNYIRHRINKESPDVFTRIAIFKDNYGSTINVIIKDEKINNINYPCYYIEGTFFDASGVFAGVCIEPDSATLNAMRTASFFSFNVLGDGNTYEVMLTTTESKTKGEDNHFRKEFTTKKNIIESIVVNISELEQSKIFGKSVPFIQSNVEYIQFQILTKGDYNLKFWDIKFFN